MGRVDEGVGWLGKRDQRLVPQVLGTHGLVVPSRLIVPRTLTVAVADFQGEEDVAPFQGDRRSSQVTGSGRLLGRTREAYSGATYTSE
jgi:hypothetical protein